MPGCGPGCHLTSSLNLTISQAGQLRDSQPDPDTFCLAPYCNDGIDQWRFGVFVCECPDLASSQTRSEKPGDEADQTEESKNTIENVQLIQLGAKLAR